MLLYVRWMCVCGQQDIEFCFSDRNTDLETNASTASIFASFTVSASKIKIRSNDYVTIKYGDPDRTDLGQVIYFSVDEDLSSRVQEYMGQGKLKYRRMPKQLYGESCIEEVQVSLVTLTKVCIAV